MYGTQLVQEPFGISVFGSSIIRVEPDVASLNFAVSRLEQHPRDAFRAARDGTESVRAYLDQAEVEDVGSSRIALSQSFRHTTRGREFEGYLARVAFHVLLHDLDRTEEILTGIVDAGANEIKAVEFQTSQLKEVRADARRRAVSAAREKAENYCKAAGVTLGPVIHIEDVNPTRLRGGEGHVTREVQLDDEAPPRAFDPGSIVVGGAVIIAFGLKRE